MTGPIELWVDRISNLRGCRGDEIGVRSGNCLCAGIDRVERSCPVHRCLVRDMKVGANRTLDRLFQRAPLSGLRVRDVGGVSGVILDAIEHDDQRVLADASAARETPTRLCSIRSSSIVALGMASDFHLFQLELERIRLEILIHNESQAAPDEAVLVDLRTQLATAVEVLQELRPMGRAHELADRLKLRPDDVELLWTAVAVSTDPSILPHARSVGGTDPRRGLSLAQYARLAGLEPLQGRTLAYRLLSHHPLLVERLLEWGKDPYSPSARSLVVPHRVVTWLAGDDGIDTAIIGGVLARTELELELDAHQRAVVESLPATLRATPSPLVIMEGPAGSGRRAALARALEANGRFAVALDASRLPDLSALEAALIALRRECTLRAAIPVIANLDAIGRTEDDARRALHAVARLIDDIPGPIAVTVRDPTLQLVVTRPLVRVRWGIPEVATRRSLWQHALVDDAPSIANLDEIARRYRMGAGGIQRAVASARLAAGGIPLEANHVIEGIRTHIAEQLGDLAERQDVTQSWDDLVLAPDIRDQVIMVVARVRHAYQVLEEWGFSSKLPKGTGVAALFSGPPGTGKTMVAGLIARELDLELYQVDLSKVVSKWVGETEKQLARIFEAADAGHALLLFDEADALFAKRTDVKSAVDRYANLEVNYLLQRIESFGGVSILTTNLEASIDPALRRRLAASIAFWPPDQHERELLWARMLVSKAPMAPGINTERLADTFDEMTGANIRNAVLAAAFLAAAEGSSITQSHLERGARGEYASMGRILGKK